MNNLTDEIIESNKQEYLELLRTISRDDSKIESLISKLESGDWFTAPASTKFHGAYKGGLVDHSLAVYYNLKRLVQIKHLDEKYNEDTIKIVALLHDLQKLNYYKQSFRNKKVYNETGKQHDNQGKYDWVSVPEYIRTPDEERFLFGSHEEQSEYMIRQFIPLTLEESVAILHHHGTATQRDYTDNLTEIFKTYKLACLLHIADQLATSIDEA